MSEQPVKKKYPRRKRPKLDAPLRAVSYGGGVQSTALLVLAAKRIIDFPLFIFSNVGDDSEHPSTLRYVREIAAPYAAEHGIELVEVRKQRRGGGEETLLQRINGVESSVPIPMRLASGAPGNRTCTIEFKIRVIAKELKRRGATNAMPAVCALGISTDEFHRARSSSQFKYETLAYPLLDLGLSRSDCVTLIADAGLPVPPKSSCWFCPYHKLSEWRRMRHEEPELFERSVAIERAMNARRAALGKDAVWISDAMRPLDEAIGEERQLDLFDETASGCANAGYCMI